MVVILPLYGAHYIKRNLLRANAACWTKSGLASLLYGRHLAAPPCIRSAFDGGLHVRGPRRGRESRTHLFVGTLALGDTGPRPSRFVASSRWPPQRTCSDFQHGALWHNPDRHIAHKETISLRVIATSRIRPKRSEPNGVDVSIIYGTFSRLITRFFHPRSPLSR